MAVITRLGTAVAERACRCGDAAGRGVRNLRRRLDAGEWDVRAGLPPDAALEERTWQVCRGGGPPAGRFVLFQPDGTLAGAPPGGATRWEIAGSRLLLRDPQGAAVQQFDRIARHPAWGIRLLGPAGTALEATPIPRRLSAVPVTLDWRIDPARGRRRNLVLIGAGEHSLHHRWPQDGGDGGRNWDLGIIFYGDAANYPPAGAHECAIHLPGTGKFAALHAVLHEGSALWQYERIFLPDDDLLMSWRDITRLFAICERHGLLLAQPALTAQSFVAHGMTRQREGSVLRFVRFVEGMAPVFTGQALRLVLPTFTLTHSGWGIDHIWPKLLGEPARGLAIIDAVPMTHTRAVGTNYSRFRARREMARLLGACGVRMDFSECGAIHAASAQAAGVSAVP
jgi:hypothetical protein